MKYLSILIIFQLTLSLVFAQITFTREWVTGKRGFPIGHQNHPHKDEKCSQSFLPVIQFLMESENIRKRECEQSKVYPLPWKGIPEFPKVVGIEKEENIPLYDGEVPGHSGIKSSAPLK